MNAVRRCLVSLLWGASLVFVMRAAAQESFALLHSFFDPSTNAQPYAQQGYSVAVDGNIAAVGEPFSNWGQAGSGAVKVYDPSTGSLLHTLTNPSPSIDAQFGYAVALSGNKLIVGVPHGNTGAHRAGRAYLYILAGPAPTVPVLTLTNPAPAEVDNFGMTVAISAARFAVGAIHYRAGVFRAGNVYVYDLTGAAAPTGPTLTLGNPSPATPDRFGISLGLSGTRLVVGSAGESIVATNKGVAYVYDLAGATPAIPWATLQSPLSIENENFGRAVAISSTRAIVGAPGAEFFGGTVESRAYVFDLTGPPPSLPMTALSNPGFSNRFGASVAISENRAMVGAHEENSATDEAGRVYVFELASALAATLVATLNNPSPSGYDHFGWSVGMSGDQLIVGAPNDGTRARSTDGGTAYTYDLADAAPIQLIATLGVGSPASYNYFGSPVSVSGTKVAVAAPSDDTGALDAGVVQVFDLASITPTTPMLTLTNPTPAFSGAFGSAVAMSATRVVVGQHYESDGPVYQGAVHVYDLAGNAPPVPVTKLINPNPRPYDSFGGAVAISGTKVIVGAVTAGSVYVYELSESANTMPMLTLTNPNPAAADTFGQAVAISGTKVVVGAYRSSVGATNAGLIQVFDLASATPQIPLVTLTNPMPAVDAWFGSAVAISGTRVAVGAYGHSAGGYYQGIAYLFDLTDPVPHVPTLILTNPQPTGSFGFDVAIFGARLVVGAHSDSTEALFAGRAYVYALASATPDVPTSILTKPNPGAHDSFGFSVDTDGTTIVVGTTRVATVVAESGAAYVFGPWPALSITPHAPGSATLSWSPATSSGFLLQWADSLAPTDWRNAPSGETNPVTLSLTNKARFYRLSQP